MQHSCTATQLLTNLSMYNFHHQTGNNFNEINPEYEQVNQTRTQITKLRPTYQGNDISITKPFLISSKLWIEQQGILWWFSSTDNIYWITVISITKPFLISSKLTNIPIQPHIHQQWQPNKKCSATHHEQPNTKCKPNN